MLTWIPNEDYEAECKRIEERKEFFADADRLASYNFPAAMDYAIGEAWYRSELEYRHELEFEAELSQIYHNEGLNFARAIDIDFAYLNYNLATMNPTAKILYDPFNTTASWTVTAPFRDPIATVTTNSWSWTDSYYTSRLSTPVRDMISGILGKRNADQGIIVSSYNDVPIKTNGRP